MIAHGVYLILILRDFILLSESRIVTLIRFYVKAIDAVDISALFCDVSCIENVIFFKWMSQSQFY